MDYANAQDVADAYEADIPEAATARVDYLLRSTSARLTAAIPALPGWVTGGQVDAELARDVVVKAVMRQLRNPTETSQTQTQSQSAGPYSTSVTYRQGSTGASLFDPADLRLLQPASSPSGPIRMTPWPSLYRECRRW